MKTSRIIKYLRVLIYIWIIHCIVINKIYTSGSAKVFTTFIIASILLCNVASKIFFASINVGSFESRITNLLIN